MQLLFLGDLLYNYDKIQPDIKEIGKYFQLNNYYTILNLEAPLKSSTPIKKWINLYQSERIFEILKLLNVKAVCLSNNHIMDWGKKGLRYLINELEKNNIGYFGAGKNIEYAVEPKILKICNKKIGLLGFGWNEEMCIYATKNTPGVAPLKTNLILTSVEKLAKLVDKVIVNLHWGYEYEVYPLPIHRKLAHQIIDYGADIIIGHHPHTIQAFEKYRNKYIYYSIGNFYFGSLRETMFNKNKNRVASEFSKYGLGIIYNISTDNLKNIFFKYENTKTKIIKNYKLENLTGISLIEYNNNYKRVRISNRKPNLYIGKYQDFINPLKLKIFKHKSLLIKVLINFFKKIGIYNFVREKYRKALFKNNNL